MSATPIGVVLVAFLAASAALPGSMPAAELDAIVARVEHDRDALHGWRWTLRTEIRLEGRFEGVELHQGSLDANGEPRHTPLGDRNNDKARGSKLPKKVAGTVMALQELVVSYAYPAPKELRRALVGAHAWPSEDGGELRIQARNVLRGNDALDLVVDGVSKRLLRCSILTSLEGEPIRLEVRFGQLEAGPVLPQVVDVATEIGERKLTLRIEALASEPE